LGGVTFEGDLGICTQVQGADAQRFQVNVVYIEVVFFGGVKIAFDVVLGVFALPLGFLLVNSFASVGFAGHFTGGHFAVAE